MLDILGREVNRGDVIVYGNKQRCGQFLSFAETKFGVVVNIIPKGKKYKLKSASYSNASVSAVFSGSTPNTAMAYTTNEYETMADKATFHDLDKVRMIHPTSNRYKNGRPKIGNAILISSCLKINLEDLTDSQKAAYDVFKAEFQL